MMREVVVFVLTFHVAASLFRILSLFPVQHETQLSSKIHRLAPSIRDTFVRQIMAGVKTYIRHVESY